MENSFKRQKKVKDIFFPHELSSKVSEKKEQEEKRKEGKEFREEEIPIIFNKFEEDIEEIEDTEKISEKENKKRDAVLITPPILKKRFTNLTIEFSKKIKLFFGGIVLLVILYFLSFIFLARAEVNLNSKKIEIPFSGNILVDRNISSIDFNKAVIPGSLFTFKADESGEYSSTGLGKDETKAKGIITIYNNYSTSPQILVATTRFETPDHKIYRLDSRVVIPGATTEDGKLIPSTIDVKVTADKAGPEYNIGACNLPDCKFTIPGFAGTAKFEGFYGVSTQPMKGGNFGSVPLIISEDFKKAEVDILEKVEKSIDLDIQNKIPEGLIILPEAKSGIKITKISSDAEVGDYREKFTVKAEAEVKVIAFKESDIIKYIQGVLNKDEYENYDYCFEPKIEYLERTVDFDKGTIKIFIKTNQKLCHNLDLEEIKESLRGKNKQELNNLFKNYEGIETAGIKIWPWWIKKIPNSVEKIKIFVDNIEIKNEEK